MVTDPHGNSYTVNMALSCFIYDVELMFAGTDDEHGEKCQ